MLRAKFEKLDEQRNFFIDVKKKLNMGSRKLIRVLDIKSRGCLESYNPIGCQAVLNSTVSRIR